ncbi:hypothetical protein Q3G72_011350 [Acer saccharum]|nr:hypothetical protein Q3G72_011350 [Acer saccharum]
MKKGWCQISRLSDYEIVGEWAGWGFKGEGGEEDCLAIKGEVLQNGKRLRWDCLSSEDKDMISVLQFVGPKLLVLATYVKSRS